MNHQLSLQQVVIFLLVEGLKYDENYQDVAQRDKGSKCCWIKIELTDLPDAGLPQNFNL